MSSLLANEASTSVSCIIALYYYITILYANMYTVCTVVARTIGTNSVYNNFWEDFVSVIVKYNIKIF